MRVQRGRQIVLDGGQIHAVVFAPRMVARDSEAEGRKQQEQDGVAQHECYSFSLSRKWYSEMPTAAFSSPRMAVCCRSNRTCWPRNARASAQ